MNLKKHVHIFVGEFSYAMNWHSPRLRGEINSTPGDHVVVTYGAFSMLYSNYVDVVALPEDITLQLQHPATIGVRPDDTTPDYVINFCRSLFPGAMIHTPRHIFAGESDPPGIFTHLHPDSQCEEFIINFLSDFRKENTICILPKLRQVGGKSGQNWGKDNWISLITNLIETGYNIVSINISDSNNAGGTYDLDIDSNMFRTLYIDKNDINALDKQSWLLKHTMCSIYGSTGAANLPFWVNTPTISIMKKDCGIRLLYNWQKRLTNNHKLNDIILIDDLENSMYSDISDRIHTHLNMLQTI